MQVRAPQDTLERRTPKTPLQKVTPSFISQSLFYQAVSPMRTGTPSFLAAALEASIGSGSYKEFIKMIQNKGKGELIR